MVRQEEREEKEARLERIIARHRQLCRELPDIDPSELLRILENLMTPFGSGRRYFIRRHGSGYVI